MNNIYIEEGGGCGLIDEGGDDECLRLGFIADQAGKRRQFLP